MFRRRYLAMVGATAVAGCQSEGGEPTTTASPTETQTDTSTSTPTDEETAEETATRRETGPLADARGSIQRGYDAYLQAAEGGGETLLDVGPATAGFATEEVQAAFDDASDQLTAASEAGEADPEAIERLRSATRWLRGAATIQGAASDAAEAIEQAATTGNFGSGAATITGHVATALEATERVEAAITDLAEPGSEAFDELGFVDGDDIREKYDAFQDQRTGFETLAGLCRRTVDAGDLIDEATQAAEAGDNELAERRAATAADELSTVLDGTDAVDPDTVQPLADRLGDAVDSLQNRAVAVQNNAQNNQ